MTFENMHVFTRVLYAHRKIINPNTIYLNLCDYFYLLKYKIIQICVSSIMFLLLKIKSINLDN